jgi:hypothetical protein
MGSSYLFVGMRIARLVLRNIFGGKSQIAKFKMAVNVRFTIVPSQLRNDRFFRRFVNDSFVNYEGHVCVPRDHNSLQAACGKPQVSV